MRGNAAKRMRNALLAVVFVYLGGFMKADAKNSIPVGPERIERLLLDAPIYESGVETRYFSSFDRSGANDDGFTGKYSALYELPNGEQVVFDALGPGCLYTLWFTSKDGGWGDLHWGRIRFYLDGSDKPAVDVEGNDLYSGRVPGFPKSLVADVRIATGGYVSYVPIPFKERLIITTERRAGFYNALYQIYPVGTEVRSWTPHDSPDALADLFRSVHGPIEKAEGAEEKTAWIEGGAKALRAELSGDWVITALRFKAERGLTRDELQTWRIKAWWDGEQKPSIDVPLGMFFGTGIHETTIGSIPIRMRREGDYEFGLPAPFSGSGVIEISGDFPAGFDATLSVESVPAQARGYDPSVTGRLKAVFNEERPTTTGEDFELLNTSGSGKFVGSVMTIEPQTPLTKQWWEGDLRVYTDGNRTQRMHGTGHEDDYLGGWSNEFLSRAFTLPMHGEPAVKMLDWEGQFNGDCSLYRFYPGISYSGGIVVSTEHGTENEKNFNYKSVAFYYELPRRLLKETDRIEGCGQVAGGEPASEAVESAFEGREYLKAFTARFESHKLPAEFTLKIEPENRGVWLRRFFDQKEGRQTADVFVDGERVGTWDTAEANDEKRFAERDYFLPESFTSGKKELRIRIEPEGEAAWSAGEYRALTITR
jgi:hypothetical protein